MPQLAVRYHRSREWIRQQLDHAPVRMPLLRPQPVVIVADMTFSKRTFGICVFRNPHQKRNLVWAVAPQETAAVYAACRTRLERQGWKLQAAVIDGKPGLFEVFKDIPVQMCHFHQIAIVTRYLTRRPKLPAGQALRILARTLPRTTEEAFTKGLDAWDRTWRPFLQEKTLNPGTKRWCYTHRRLRAAYRSLRKNLPLLYTYQRFPELRIPNTTNSLDGTFSYVKNVLNVHRGLNRTRRLKVMREILSK